MKKNSITTIFILVLLSLGLTLPAGNSPATQGKRQHHHGRRHGQNARRDTIPEEIVLQGIDGQSWNKSSLEGKIVILEFWATWCAPCLKQIPKFKEIHEKYKDRDVLILGINLDNTETITKKRWLRRNAARMGWPQLFNRNGFSGELPRHFDIDEVPTNLIFNRQGQLVGRGVSPPEIINKIENLLKENRSLIRSKESDSKD